MARQMLRAIQFLRRFPRKTRRFAARTDCDSSAWETAGNEADPSSARILLLQRSWRSRLRPLAHPRPRRGWQGARTLPPCDTSGQRWSAPAAGKPPRFGRLPDRPKLEEEREGIYT